MKKWGSEFMAVTVYETASQAIQKMLIFNR